MHGVPIAVKELFDVADADGSYGSEVLADRRAPADAAVVASLRRAGAVVVGTTRAHEFGWGITTQHATRGSTHNPWHLDRIPGGSSGGSAAAVAAGMVPLAVASDTGGSIRIPAAFCGVFGLKTTPGASPAGAASRSPRRSTRSASSPSTRRCSRRPSPRRSALTPVTRRRSTHPRSARGRCCGVAEVRFCVPDASGGISPTTAHVAALNTVSAALAELGARQVDVSLPTGASLYEIFVPHQMAEAHHIHHSVLGTYPSQAARYGADVRARLEAAAAVTIVDYLDARRLAADARGRFLDAFTSVDLVVALVSPCGPSTVDNPNAVDVDGRSVPLRDAVMPSTVPQNISGLPSVTVPAGLRRRRTADRGADQRTSVERTVAAGGRRGARARRRVPGSIPDHFTFDVRQERDLTMPRARLADGLELNYELFGDAAAPAVVLVRGTGADGTRWMPQVEAYRDEFRVLIFDNRGVGGSDTPPGPYTVADMAGDTVALLDILGIERCHLSGSSLGGAICAHIAIEHPQRVRSLQMHSSWLATRGYTAYSLGLLQQLPRHRRRRLLLRGRAAVAVQPAVHVPRARAADGRPRAHEGASRHLRGTARSARGEPDARPE